MAQIATIAAEPEVQVILSKREVALLRAVVTSLDGDLASQVYGLVDEIGDAAGLFDQDDALAYLGAVLSGSIVLNTRE